jgi:hypothetical protein
MFDEIRAALAELDHFSAAKRGPSDKLHVELSQRIKENAQLRQQVDSTRKRLLAFAVNATGLDSVQIRKRTISNSSK